MVQGATLRRFIEGFGVGDKDSAKLWKYRQMMHGAVRFDPGTGGDCIPGPTAQGGCRRVID
jgi:hypothetical protein